MNYYIGTSGWCYYHWRDQFYPHTIKSTEYLNYYVQHFDTVELNSSFYNLPTAKSCEHWYNSTPDNFVFSCKAWREITHILKLKNCQEKLAAFLERVEILQEKLGPILFQLPPSLKYDPELLKSFLNLLPDGKRFVVEFRHRSWFADDIYQLLEMRNIAFCVFELDKLKSPFISTADFNYVRLHGNNGRYKGDYSQRELENLYKWLHEQKKDSYVYFDNTASGITAITNAQMLIQITKSKLSTSTSH